jgi:hypothetical protein
MLTKLHKNHIYLFFFKISQNFRVLHIVNLQIWTRGTTITLLKGTKVKITYLQVVLRQLYLPHEAMVVVMKGPSQTIPHHQLADEALLL